MQEIITAWQTGLFYSKFMLIFWITIPFVGLLVTAFIEQYFERVGDTWQYNKDKLKWLWNNLDKKKEITEIAGVSIPYR